MPGLRVSFVKVRMTYNISSSPGPLGRDDKALSFEEELMRRYIDLKERLDE